MPKLIIMVGLPASGKTTRSFELMKEQGGTIRISKDALREMMHTGWSGKNERHTHEASRTLAEHFLRKGINTLIDDTNLNPSVLQGWKDLAKTIGVKAEVVTMDTPYDECLDRNEKRLLGRGGVGVPRDAIVGMAMRYGLYPKPVNGIVICDLDGSLCDIEHRRHFVDGTNGEKKDWRGFFAGIAGDSVRKDVLDMVLTHGEAGREIFFVSGRPDTYRDVTEAWLEREMHGVRLHRALFMRRGNDSRDDTIIKREIYDAYFKTFDVVEVIDDRKKVIEMWRSLGLNVVDVGTGEDF